MRLSKVSEENKVAREKLVILEQLKGAQERAVAELQG